MLEGGCDGLEHIKGTCKVPSPAGWLQSRVLTRKKGEEQRADCLRGHEGGGVVGMMAIGKEWAESRIGPKYARRL